MDAAVAAAVAAKPLPSLPAAKVSPFEAVTRVASMFARSGSSAAGPNVAQQAEAARQAAKRAALRGDASMARALTLTLTLALSPNPNPSPNPKP